MSRARRTAVAIITLTLQSYACTSDLRVPEEAWILCNSDADCPEGWACLEEASRCIRGATTPDAFLQFITSPEVTPARVSRVAGYDQLTVTFALNRDVAPETPGLEVQLDELSLACARTEVTEGYGYACGYSPGPSDLSGLKEIVVAAEDSTGRATDVARVTFDFEAPEVAGVTLQPAAAAVGALVLARVFFDEAVVDLPPDKPMLVTDAATPITFAMDDHGGDVVTFTHTVDAADPEGSFALTLSGVEDLVGNVAVPATLVGQEVTLDSSPPDILDLEPSATRYSANAGYNRVVASFTLDEAPESVDATVGGLPMTCNPVAGLNYECSYTVPPLGPTDPRDESVRAVVVRTTDAAGNRDIKSVEVTFDFAPPDLAPGTESLVLLPAASNVMGVVSAVTADTVVRVSFALDEAVPTDPQVASSVPATLPFTNVNPGSSFFIFEASITAGVHPDGIYSVVVTATDSVGNSQPFFLSQTFVVDTVAPAPPDSGTPERIVYFRVPYGNDDTAVVPTFAVRGTAGAVPGQTTVIAYDSTGATAQEVGRVVAAADGSFGDVLGGAGTQFELNRADRPRIYLETVDGAGNQSPRVLVRDVRWVATLGGKVPGQTLGNPTTLTTTGRFAASWVQDPNSNLEPSPGEVPRVERLDGSSLERTSEGLWEEHEPSSSSTPGFKAGMAYDPTRGQALIHNGDLWRLEPGTNVLTLLEPPGARPTAVSGQSLVFEPKADATLMYGGLDSDNNPLDAMWSYDGIRWTQIAQGSPWPGTAVGHAMTYDGSSGAVMLHGGGTGGDTFLYENGSWRAVSQMNGPPDLATHAMAYDPTTGTVLMFDGENRETWEWSSRTELWTLRTPATSPSFRVDFGLAFDPTRDAVLLAAGASCYADFSGCDLYSDLWEWTGSNWQTVSFTGNGPRVGGLRLVTDTAWGRLLSYGGCYYLDDWACFENTGNIFEWDGADAVWRFKLGAAGSPTPPVEAGHAMAFDGDRNMVVMFGGYLGTNNCVNVSETCDGLWEYDVALRRWLQPSPGYADPLMAGHVAERFMHDIAFDGLSVVMVAGQVSSTLLRDCWEWDGAFWNLRCGFATWGAESDACMYMGSGHSLVFDANAGHLLLIDNAATMAWDEPTFNWVDLCGAASDCDLIPTEPRSIAHDLARGVTVLFGGGETWEWNGSAWLERTPAVSPTTTQGAAMAYNSGLEAVELFENDTDKLWVWDGVAGDWRDITPVTVGPAQLRDADLVFDDRAMRTVLFGDQQTWLHNSGATERPAAIWSIPVAAAEATDAVVVGIATRVVGGACSSAVGVRDGATLALWHGRRAAWESLAGNGAGCSAPAQLSHVPLRGEAAAAALAGYEQFLTLAVRSVGEAGPRPDQAAVAVDYLEAEVSYVWPPASCGDTVLDADEECDDGDNNDDDGCSALCRLEFCGDGFVQPSRGEACDDGNTVDTDGCRNDCRLP